MTPGFATATGRLRPAVRRSRVLQRRHCFHELRAQLQNPNCPARKFAPRAGEGPQEQANIANRVHFYPAPVRELAAAGADYWMPQLD